MTRTAATAMMLALVLLSPSTALATGASGAKGKTPQAVEPVPGQTVPGTSAPTTTAPATPAPAPAPAVDPSAAAGASGAAGTVSRTSTATSSRDGLRPITVAAIVIFSLLLATLLFAAIWHLRGWDPRWRRRWRHALGEAGYRTSLSAAELRDFLRLGR